MNELSPYSGAIEPPSQNHFSLERDASPQSPFFKDSLLALSFQRRVAERTSEYVSPLFHSPVSRPPSADGFVFNDSTAHQEASPAAPAFDSLPAPMNSSSSLSSHFPIPVIMASTSSSSSPLPSATASLSHSSSSSSSPNISNPQTPVMAIVWSKSSEAIFNAAIPAFLPSATATFSHSSSSSFSPNISNPQTPVMAIVLPKSSEAIFNAAIPALTLASTPAPLFNEPRASISSRKRPLDRPSQAPRKAMKPTKDSDAPSQAKIAIQKVTASVDERIQFVEKILSARPWNLLIQAKSDNLLRFVMGFLAEPRQPLNDETLTKVWEQIDSIPSYSRSIYSKPHFTPFCEFIKFPQIFSRISFLSMITTANPDFLFNRDYSFREKIANSPQLNLFIVAKETERRS